MAGRAHSEQGDPPSMPSDRGDARPDQEAGALPLASLVDIGAPEIEFADHAVPPSSSSPAPDALDGLLSDALFGDVIDISDLIPSVLSPPAEATVPGIPGAEMVGTADLGLADSGHMLAAAGHAVGLTILYDDDILASDGTIL